MKTHYYDYSEGKPRERLSRRREGKINEDGEVIPLDLKPGDRILFGKSAGNEVALE